MKTLLLLVLVALAIAASGCSTSSWNSGTTASVGTFNIEWLGDGVNDKIPRTDAEYLLIADVIARTGVDVMAVQEIENSAALHKVLRYLKDYDGAVGEMGGAQNVGVVYKKGIDVTVVGNYAPLQLDRPDRLRPGLILECRKGAFGWLQLCVHLKSTSRYDSTPAMANESRELRTQQAEVLSRFADSVLKSGKQENVIIAGDFNDFPTRRNNPTLNVLKNGPLTFLTSNMQSCANPKWTTIDHVLVSASAAKRVMPDGVRMEHLADFLGEEDAKRVSDHCPVIVVFNCTP